MTEKEETLVNEMHAGSTSAAETLIRQYYRDVFGYIYRYTGDYHLSYDLTQETFVKMVNRVHTLKQGGAFRAWLFMIAINTCRDYYKSRSYKQVRHSDVLEEDIRVSNWQVTDLLAYKEDCEVVK